MSKILHGERVKLTVFLPDGSPTDVKMREFQVTSVRLCPSCGGLLLPDHDIDKCRRRKVGL